MLKDEIELLLKEKNLTFKELAAKAGLNANGLHNKFKRDSLTVNDLRKLLKALEKEMVFRDISDNSK